MSGDLEIATRTKLLYAKAMGSRFQVPSSLGASQVEPLSGPTTSAVQQDVGVRSVDNEVTAISHRTDRVCLGSAVEPSSSAGIS